MPNNKDVCASFHSMLIPFRQVTSCKKQMFAISKLWVRKSILLTSRFAHYQGTTCIHSEPFCAVSQFEPCSAYLLSLCCGAKCLPMQLVITKCGLAINPVHGLTLDCKWHLHNTGSLANTRSLQYLCDVSLVSISKKILGCDL